MKNTTHDPIHPHRFHPTRALGATCAAALLFAPLAASAEPEAIEEVVEESVESEETRFRVVQIVENLEHPWGMAWLPDGRMIVTERPGRMHLVDLDSRTVQELGGLPEIDTDEDQLTAPEGGNQGGLLDVAVHPDYANNGWIYFTYSSPGDDDSVMGDDERGTGTALARGRLNEEENRLEEVETIYAQVPRRDPGRHYGSRILFPGDGTVIFSIGDRGLRFVSQDLTDPGGSMIRIREDGGAPDDNPFVGREPGNLRPEIYSFGHRNNQGLAMHPETGQIWATDHGPSGGDLLYRIEKGNNYGWPQVAFGTEYATGEHIGIGREAPGVTPPAHWWKESLAPSGLAFYNGEHFPAWNGHLFAGFLLTEHVSRLVLDDEGRVVHEERLFEETIGRIRDVRQGPDGLLYLATDEEEGGIYRLEPIQETPAQFGAPDRRDQ